MAVLPQRCARCGLTLHPTQTAGIACRKPAAHQGADRGNGPCTLLGRTPAWTKARRGGGVMQRRTASTRLRRTKKLLGRWGRRTRHAPLQYQYQRLCSQLRGHCQSYGMQENCRLLEEVRRFAARAWRSWLRRRRRQSALQWDTFEKLRRTSILTLPRIVHHI
jgi:hypothetical protein